MAAISKEIGLDDAIRGIGMGNDRGAASSSSDDEKSGSDSGVFKGAESGKAKAKEIESIH